MANLLDPVSLSATFSLRNRVCMSSLTRNRCVDNSMPGPSQVQYYTDRARYGTGLIVTEGVLVDWAGCAFPYAPCLITTEHAKAWRKVVDSVHKEGGKILLQAWHPGRIQNENMPAVRDRNQPVLAPSAIKAEGGKYKGLPNEPGHTANITVIQNPRGVVETYRKSSILAKMAGFDGIELLAQGGYLPHQFLNSRSNHRTDAYGGSVENRCRFTLEIVDAISEVFGGYEFVCIKISPADALNDSAVSFEEMQEIYTYLIKEFVKRQVGIVNISRRGYNSGAGRESAAIMFQRPEQYPLPPNYDPVLDFGRMVKYPGSPSKLMVNQDYTAEEADLLIRQEKADLVSFGRPFIYNPDVVPRLQKGIAFAENDRDSTVFYGPYETPDENYNDWPAALA
ncbi:FMN-linked oxidoreductase [Sarocladium strictum]